MRATPGFAEFFTFGFVVSGMVADMSERNSVDEPSVDGGIEGIPNRLGRPGVISWQDPALRKRRGLRAEDGLVCKERVFLDAEQVCEQHGRLYESLPWFSSSVKYCQLFQARRSMFPWKKRPP